MDTNLIRIDENLNGVVSPALAKCTNETLGHLEQLWKICGHEDSIKKKTVQVICARTYETFYSSLVMLQIEAGATLGLQVRSHLECIADIVGFAENPKYLEE